MIQEKSVSEKRRGRPKKAITDMTEKKERIAGKGLKRDRGNDFNLKQYDSFQISSGGIGTIGRKNYKSVYFKLHGHLVCDNDDAIRDLKYFHYLIKQTIAKNLNYEFYKKDFISILDISDTFRKKPYTHFTFDFTFFSKSIFSSKFHISFLNDLIETINKKHFVNPPFKVYRHKTELLQDNQDVYLARETIDD